MGISAGFPGPVLWTGEAIHSGADLSASSVHPSYTEPWAGPPATTRFVHSIHMPYYNDETYRDGSSPEYLGKRQRLNKAPGEVTTGQVLAGGPGGIKVSAHLL